jgi:arylsulfatase A-like enzyme
LGAAGYPCLLTPTLDQLAENGVRFSNAYSAVPVCIAARRALMTGATPRTHGDRGFAEQLRMPDNLPTLAQTFRDAGYQAYAVGKLHVYPQRDRIGFDDVLINEEGRHHLGLLADDYELFLADAGFPGQEYTHAMSNNQYCTRPWHLPEHTHPTNWTVREMCRVIKRRDPTRPAFWYMSFNFPHPPLVPLRDYLDMYRDAEIPEPFIGEWARDFERLPYALKARGSGFASLSERELRLARQAFYATCTHIDHQIRLVIGMLREERLLDNTIIGFTSDHGDMLGNHNLYAKRVYYEEAAKVPMLIVPTADYARMGHHQVDDRLVELRDVMPTLLDLAGIPIPKTVEGISLATDARRETLYGEQDAPADGNTRMMRDSRFKLIYYPVGNRVQLFDLLNDPDELRDLAADPAYAEARERLTGAMIAEFYGGDEAWAQGGKLVGLPEKVYQPRPDRGLLNQRGWRFM